MAQVDIFPQQPETAGSRNELHLSELLAKETPWKPQTTQAFTTN